MTIQTYFVVEAFEEDDNGLVASPPIFCFSADEAIARAEFIHDCTGLGVIAWQRVGNIDLAVWEGLPEVLYSAGRTGAQVAAFPLGEV